MGWRTSATTWPELIRTPAAEGRVAAAGGLPRPGTTSPGSASSTSASITELFTTDGAISGCFGYLPRRLVCPVRRNRRSCHTGGVGKSYSVTSNSWEYTGDGHALPCAPERR
ncbi:hypothetical protein HBB16_03390 [Pseudonocardia sp. MCCB 268]|nr:hypothetical protein [Pseudonocardia cytotoxica]